MYYYPKSLQYNSYYSIDRWRFPCRSGRDVRGGNNAPTFIRTTSIYIQVIPIFRKETELVLSPYLVTDLSFSWSPLTPFEWYIDWLTDWIGVAGDR